MVGHSEGIRDILVAYSGYAGGYSPSNRGINEVDASNKFFISMGEEVLSDTHWTSEQYKLTLQASSEANLQTLKNALLNCATDRPSGFIPSASYDSKLYQYESEDVYRVDAQTGSDNYPIAAGETTASYYYGGTAKTTLNIASSDTDAEGDTERSTILNFLNMIQVRTNYSSVKLGLYGYDTGGTVDYTIHLINEADGKYASILAEGPGDHETVTVGTAYTSIDAFSADTYNEYTVTTLLTENGTTDPYIKFLIGAATDVGEIFISFYRYDSDGDVPSSKYPYLEFTYDFTATGYPYRIEFTSPSATRMIGPNRYELDLSLLATYEV